MRAVVQFKRQTTSMERVIRRMRLLGMGRAFSRWKQFTRQRLLVCRIVLRWQQRLLAASFERWQHWVEKRLRASEVGEDRAAFITLRRKHTRRSRTAESQRRYQTLSSVFFAWADLLNYFVSDGTHGSTPPLPTLVQQRLTDALRLLTAFFHWRERSRAR